MTTPATTSVYDESCSSCDQAEGPYWVDSTPDTDTWACRHCATEWTITVTVARR